MKLYGVLTMAFGGVPLVNVGACDPPPVFVSAKVALPAPPVALTENDPLKLFAVSVGKPNDG